MNAAAHKESFMNRFRVLIEEGQRNKNKNGPEWVESWGEDSDLGYESYMSWISRVESLLNEVLPSRSPVKKRLEQLRKVSRRSKEFEGIMGILDGVMKDFDSDLFNSMRNQISNSISLDYLELAANILDNKSSAEVSYIPAAVLAGATLEKHLRDLCVDHNPQISIVKSNGKHKCMNDLIDDLCRQKVFNKTYAKQLQAWAAIRNDAAHGNAKNFDKNRVEQMIDGIGELLKRGPHDE